MGSRTDFIAYPNTCNVNIPFQAQFLARASPTIASHVGTILPTPTNLSITALFHIAYNYLSSTPDRLWVFVLSGQTVGISSYELSITKL